MWSHWNSVASVIIFLISRCNTYLLHNISGWRKGLGLRIEADCTLVHDIFLCWCYTNIMT